MRKLYLPLAFLALLAANSGCARLSRDSAIPGALSYPLSYEASRAAFREKLSAIQQLWPNATVAQHSLSGEEGLTIDWIRADATEHKERLLVLSAGEHGMEAYVGTSVLQLFIHEYVPRLDPKTTGILLVHCINPWGMKHRRRTNRNNVDLNRNFVWTERELDRSANPDNLRLNALLQPQGRVGGRVAATVGFVARLVGARLRVGEARLREATLGGQYRLPQGLYYGGNSHQEETRILMALFRRHFEAYPRILHLDMHTGYGPSHPMLLVTSLAEPRCPADLAQQFQPPGRVEVSGGDFYAIRGDMIDYVYRLVHTEFPSAHLFAATFEFGTLGEGTMALVRSLRAEIVENNAYWFGTAGRRTRAWVDREFEALNAPPDLDWRAKAADDARRAFRGILAAEGYLPSTREP